MIPHGVDLVRFRPNAASRVRVRDELRIHPDALVAVFVGGDWSRKGLDHAIRSTAIADGWQLVVVGAGDESAYSAVAHAAGVGDRVHFVGSSTDTPAFFAAADAFVLPTSYETFSLVTYEAAAAGLPLLVSRVSGPDQLILETINGAFLDASPRHTADWLERLRNPAVRKTMGTAARQSAEAYTWDVAVDRHIALYDELARTAAGQRAGPR
jgi:UDP-glucose:(heptosyl)LPS alpha-1,3-glucosyltransferase